MVLVGRGLLGGRDRVRKEGSVGARCWRLRTRGPERASPTPNLAEGETEALEGGICLLPQSHGEHTAKPPALGTLPAAGLPLLLPRGVSEQVGSASRAPTDLSCRTAGRATHRACQEAPSQGAKLCRAGSGSLAPSKESKQGKREAVESEKLQQVRACEAGPLGETSRAERGCPQGVLSAVRSCSLRPPGLASPPAHHLIPALALAQPAWSALGGPHCLCGKRRQETPPQLLAWWAPGLPTDPRQQGDNG